MVLSLWTTSSVFAASGLISLHEERGRYRSCPPGSRLALVICSTTSGLRIRSAGLTRRRPSMAAATTRLPVARFAARPLLPEDNQ